MAFEITVQNTNEFQELVNNQDFRISQAIVYEILKEIDSNKKQILALSIICLDEDEIYDITIERKHFAETLEENLPHFIREEKYEDCRLISDAILNLKSKNISNIITKIQEFKK